MVSTNVLSRWYQNRIGTPTTDDEVYGYWLFVAGLVVGALGLVLFYAAAPRSTLREFGYVFGALAVIALFVGPTLRLPLSRKALFVSYAGALVCLLATLWFAVTYPAGWSGPEGNPAVTLYVVGLALAAVGAVVAPLLTGRQAEYDRARKEAADSTADAQQATTERNELAEELVTSEAAREDISGLLSASEAELASAQATLAAARES